MMFGGWRRRPLTASEWFAARRAGANAKLERRFQQWLAERAANREEYALCELAWEISRTAAERIPLPATRPRGSRPLLLGTMASGMAVALAALAVWFWPPTSHTWTTAAGEQRILTLEDGSRVTLNTRTSIQVRLGRARRDVELRAGEAYFEVAKDASRPFTVRTRLGSATALGTRFNVYLDRERVAVTTEEGSVRVEGPREGSGVVVKAGRQAELSDDTSTPRLSDADLSRTLNWLTQRLEVDDVRLASLLADFSRYTTWPVRAETAAIADLRVSAVLRTGDLEALAATLEGALGLRLEQRHAEYVVVAVRPPLAGGVPQDGIADVRCNPHDRMQADAPACVEPR